MAKCKVGKFFLFSALAGAAAFGAYYFLRKNEVITPVYEEDDDSEYVDDLDGEPTKARSYVSLTFDKAKAEDLAKSAVKKAKDTIQDGVQKVEEFFNDERTEVVDSIAEEKDGAVEETAEDSAE